MAKNLKSHCHFSDVLFCIENLRMKNTICPCICLQSLSKDRFFIGQLWCISCPIIWEIFHSNTLPFGIQKQNILHRRARFLCNRDHCISFLTGLIYPQDNWQHKLHSKQSWSLERNTVNNVDNFMKVDEIKKPGHECFGWLRKSYNIITYLQDENTFCKCTSVKITFFLQN